MSLSADDINEVWAAAVALALALEDDPSKFGQMVESVKKARLSLVNDQPQAGGAMETK